MLLARSLCCLVADIASDLRAESTGVVDPFHQLSREESLNPRVLREFVRGRERERESRFIQRAVCARAM